MRRPSSAGRRPALARLVNWAGMERIAISLPLLTVFAGLLLAVSILLEVGPLELFGAPASAAGTWPTGAPVAALTLAPDWTPAPGSQASPTPDIERAAAASPVTATPAPPTATPRPTSTPLPLEPGDMNILLLGSDRRPEAADRSWRTDAIVVVAVRRRAKVAAMLSIPRDLWVTIPGFGQERVNAADFLGERAHGSGGGPALLGETLQQNLGIPIHAYARVDFGGLVRIIDTLGGVTVTVDRPIDEWIEGSDTPDMWHLQVQAGTQHMDGRTALGYARSRLGTTDLDRTRRQQQILLAIRDAALRPAVLPRLPSLLTALWGAVGTNLSPEEVLSLAALAGQIDPGSYRTRVFDSTMVRDWVTPQGAMVLVFDRSRVEQVWAELTAVD